MWQPPLGQGAGALTQIGTRVWKLDWQNKRYSVKAPRSPHSADVADFVIEARLHTVPHEQGYPVAQVHWVEHGCLLVTEWIDGPSREELLTQPQSRARQQSTAQCIEGLAHMEEAESIFRLHMQTERPDASGSSWVATHLLAAVKALSPHITDERTLLLCQKLAHLICQASPTAGVADITPQDVVIGPKGAVFLDIGVLAWWWPERRFCQYFARGQQDPPDRAYQSSLFLELFPESDAERLDTHYLWHDVSDLAAWRDFAAQYSHDRSVRGGRTAISTALAAGERLKWPGASPAANDLRATLKWAARYH